MELNATLYTGLAGTQERWLRLAFAGFCGLILPVGLLANGLLLMVVAGGPRAARPLSALTTSLLVNVTLSDLLFVSFLVPALLLSFLRRGWWLGPAVCTASQATNTTTMFCTFYSMVASALVRHVAMVWPRVALPAGPRVRLLLCGAMWVLGLATSMPNWLFQRVTVLEQAPGVPEALACLLMLSPPQTTCYFTLLGALAFLPCLLGLGCSFGHVAWRLCTRPSGPPGESVQEHRANTRLSLVMLVVFVLLWGPCSALGYVSAVGRLPATPWAFVASSLCTLLAYSSCAVGPVLCFCLCRPYRAGLRALFHRSRTAAGGVAW